MNKQEIKLSLDKIYSQSVDIHSIYTPLELCEEMINSIQDYDNKSILCLNLEFLIILKQKEIDMSNVHYSTSCEIKKSVALSIGLTINNIYFLEYNNNESII